jgi:hypothetical protein
VSGMSFKIIRDGFMGYLFTMFTNGRVDFKFASVVGEDNFAAWVQ